MSSTFSGLRADVVAFIRSVAEHPRSPRAARVEDSADSREDVAQVVSKAVAGIFVLLWRPIYRGAPIFGGGCVSRGRLPIMPDGGALPRAALKHGSFPNLVASGLGEAHSPAAATGDRRPCGALLASHRSGRRLASSSPRRLLNPQKKTGRRQNCAACHFPPDNICDPAVTK